MKKIYEKPVLTTEQIDVDDVITASAPVPATLTSTGSNWEISNIPKGDVQFY